MLAACKVCFQCGSGIGSGVPQKSVPNYGAPLQGEETFEFVPNSQFTVSRTAHRNNSSDYYIDDKKSNFTEVTKLLKSKGIDLDNNRFLILQVRLHKVCHTYICRQRIACPQLESAATSLWRSMDNAQCAFQQCN